MRFKLRTLLLSTALFSACIVAGRYALMRPERRELPFSATDIRDDYNVWVDWEYSLTARINEADFVRYVRKLGLAPSISEPSVYEYSDDEKIVRAWYSDGFVCVEALGD